MIEMVHCSCGKKFGNTGEQAVHSAIIAPAGKLSSPEHVQQSPTYWKEVGGYAGVAWINGQWMRFDCETCGLNRGHLKPGTRRQGPPTNKQWEAYKGQTLLKWHKPECHKKKGGV